MPRSTWESDCCPFECDEDERTEPLSYGSGGGHAVTRQIRVCRVCATIDSLTRRGKHQLADELWVLFEWYERND